MKQGIFDISLSQPRCFVTVWEICCLFKGLEAGEAAAAEGEGPGGAEPTV